MKKLFFFKIALSIFFTLYANSTNIEQARAIGIFDENGNGENIQHVRKTKNDYNGTCFTKVSVFGNFYHTTPNVYIGNSKGYLQKEETIFNKNKIKIGTTLLYKHYNVTNGYIKVSIDNRIYDLKVFVK